MGQTNPSNAYEGMTRNQTGLSQMNKTKQTNLSNVPGLVRTNSYLNKSKAGVKDVSAIKPAPVMMSKNGLPVLPFKKISPEVLAAIKDKEE